VGAVEALPVIECCGLYAKHKQNKVDQRYDLSTSMSNNAVLVTLLLVFVVFLGIVRHKFYDPPRPKSAAGYQCASSLLAILLHLE
jgi:hypothetical protein